MVPQMAKKTVESSLALDILDFTRKDCLHPGAEGVKDWHRGERVLGSITWQMTAEDSLELTYLLRASHQGPSVRRSYPVKLTRTPTRFDGERPWFLCPSCKKKVRKLYLPPGATYFLCRSCHDLSYQSRQTRRSPGEKALVRAEHLIAELKDPRTSTRRAVTLYKEAQELLEVARNTDFLAGLRSSLRRLKLREEQEPPPSPKRARGRPKLKRPYVRQKPFTTSERTSTEEALCLRCREFRTMEDPHPRHSPQRPPGAEGHLPGLRSRDVPDPEGLRGVDDPDPDPKDKLTP